MAHLTSSIKPWVPLVCAVLAGCYSGISWAADMPSAGLPELNWPTIQWPTAARRFSIANTMSVQGVPMQLHGFTSTLPPHELIAHLQKIYGDQLVKTQQTTDTVLLGKQEGNGYFLNFRIKPAANLSGSQGEVSVAPLAPVPAYAQQFVRDQRWWNQHLPYGYRLLQHQVSVDLKQQALYLIIHAHASVADMRRVLTRALMHQGLQPDSGGQDSNSASVPIYFNPSNSLPPSYRSLDGHALNGVVTIHPHSQGSHSAIVNIVYTRSLHP
jgi:hypothetical protein